MTSKEVGGVRRISAIKTGIDGAVLVAQIDAPPMNLLGPELVRDLVSLIAEMNLAGMLGRLGDDERKPARPKADTSS
jgi:hypothetical protein